MTGIACAMLGCGGAAIRLTAALAASSTPSPGTATAIIRYLSDGQSTKTENGVTSSITNWYTPSTTSIGALFWIRATYTGDAPTGSAAGTWVQLTSTVFWSLVATAGQSKSCILPLSLASDSLGVHILATATVTLTAESVV